MSHSAESCRVRFLSGIVLCLAFGLSFASPPTKPAVTVSLVSPVAGVQTFFDVAIAPDGKYGVLALMRRISVVDPVSGFELAQAPTGPSWTYAVDIDPSGRFVAAGGSDGLRVFAAPRFEEVHAIRGADVGDVKFSADGSRLVVGFRSGRVIMLGVGSGWSQVASFQIEGPLSVVAISPDGRTVAGAQGYNDDRPRARPEAESESLIQVWSVGGSSTQWSAKAHRNDVAGMVFVAGGAQLLTGAGGRRPRGMQGPSLRLWEVATGRLLSEFGGFSQRVSAIAPATEAPAGAYVIAHGGQTGSSPAADLLRVDVEKAALSVVCERLPQAPDRLSVSRDSRIALGVPAWGPGPVVWPGFPDCAAARSRGFPADLDSSADSIVHADNGVMVLPLKSGLLGYNPLRGLIQFRTTAGVTAPGVLRTGPGPDQFTTLERRALVVRRLANGEIEKTVTLAGSVNGFQNFAHTGDGEAIAAVEDSSARRSGQSGSGTGELVRFSLETGAALVRAVVHSDQVTRIVPAPGRPFVLTASWDGRIMAVDRKTLQVIRTYFRTDEQIRDLAISPDGRRFAAVWSYEEDGSGTVGVWDIDQERPLWRGGGYDGFDAVVWTRDGVSIVAAAESVVEMHAGSGREVRRYHGLPSNRSIRSVALLDEDRLLVGNSQGGNIYTWDRRASQSPLAQSFLTASGVVTIAGERFDTSTIEQLDAIGWLPSDDPLRPLPAEIFMRDHFEPRLMSRLVGCLAIHADHCGRRKGVGESIGALNRVQPEVKIVGISEGATKDSVRVRVKATPVKDESQPNWKTRTEAYDLRLFRDGQLVHRWPDRADVGGDDVNEWRRRTQVPSGEHEFVVALPTSQAGREVGFTAYAFNEDRVKSATDEPKIHKVATDVKARPRRAYVITVGADEYEAPQRRLHFAVSDAKAMASALSQLQGYETVAVSLTSQGRDPRAWRATRGHIQAVLAKLAGRTVSSGALDSVAGAGRLAKATPDDLVIVTFSGHGHTTADGRFYLLASDSGPAKKEITKKDLDRFISSDELSEWLRPVDAGQMALIIDACHSAASVDQPGFKPGPMGDRGLGQLAYDKAMRILAASQADAVALESAKLKQGLLTYALVHDGLAMSDGRRAADADRNGQLTLAEWLRWGEQHTPVLYADISARRKEAVHAARDGVIDPRLKERAITKAQTPALFDFARPSQSHAVLR